MLELLRAAEQDLPRLVASPDGWRGFKLEHHPPVVDRLLREYRDGKIVLHRIHPCAPGLAQVHRHPWPSAMRLLEGSYELLLGCGAGERPPPIATRLIATSPFEYEMTEADAWHAVRAIDAPAMTIMVTGPRWNRTPPPNENLPDPRPLDEAEIASMLEYYRRRYPR